MPQGDGTGPLGQGPKTGRAMGYCAGYSVPGCMNPGFGRGMGRGRGFAWRARAFQAMTTQPIMPVQQIPLTKKEEKQYLEQELEALKQEMKAIEERLKELK